MTEDNIEFIVNIDDNSISNKMHIWDVYLNIVGYLQIKVNSNLILLDESHPIVELAISLQRWLNKIPIERNSFEHYSLEYEEQTLWFRKIFHGYEIGSNINPSRKKHIVKELDLISACELYIDYVETYLKQKGYVFQDYVVDYHLASSSPSVE